MNRLDFDVKELPDAQTPFDGAHERLVNMAIALDCIDAINDEHVQYWLWAPTAGLDAVTNPRIAVYRESDGELIGVWEMTYAPNSLKWLGGAWANLEYELETGDGTLPWSGDTIPNPNYPVEI